MCDETFANMHKVRECYSEANQVQSAEDCRVYADYEKTRQIGSGPYSREAWADAVLCCTCTCGHLKTNHYFGVACGSEDIQVLGRSCSCREFRPIKPETRAVEGTYECPICGCATPHAHSPKEIAEWRASQ